MHRRSSPRAAKGTCWKTDAANAGSEPCPPPIVSAISSENPVCRSPVAFEGDFVNVLTRIQRDCRARREKSPRKIINRKALRKSRKETFDLSRFSFATFAEFL